MTRGPERTVIEGCAIATVDGRGTEYSSGYIAIEGKRISALGNGSVPSSVGDGARRIDATGCLATPGLVNCHHHLYQWLTRGLAQEATLFEWLTSLYPIWAHIDTELTAAAARAGLSALARSGCSTTTDHHYVFPSAAAGALEAEVDVAGDIGVRFHPCRGSMDLGSSSGGLPPDEVTEDRDEILRATEAAIDKHHDPSFDSMVRIAIAPCSPFSVTRELMRDSAELARRKNVRLHTHLAETLDEERFCEERFGVRPVEYLEDLGWLGEDVWLAHCIHLNDAEVASFGATGTGVAHCPTSNARLGAGIAPVAPLLAAGAPVGLGVDGAASNESGEIGPEIRQAMLFARLRGGPGAVSARRALELATAQGARCLGRAREIGSLEVGKMADIALWRIDGLDHAGMDDVVAGFVLGAPRAVWQLIVNGRFLVDRGEVVTSDVAKTSDQLSRAAQELRRRSGASS